MFLSDFISTKIILKEEKINRFSELGVGYQFCMNSPSDIVLLTSGIIQHRYGLLECKQKYYYYFFYYIKIMYKTNGFKIPLQKIYFISLQLKI